MKRLLQSTGAALLIALAIIIGANPRNVYGQAQAVLFGSYMNAAKAVTVTTNGYLNVSINGGGAGVVPVANGGTGIASYTIGDMLYASGATTLSKLADVATGSVLCSGGVATAPAWCTTVAAGTIVASAPFKFSWTWNNAGVTFTGLNIDITNTASGAASNALDITNGSGGHLFQIGTAGNFISNSAGQVNGPMTIISASDGFVVQSGGFFHAASSSYINFPTDGKFKFGANAFNAGFSLDAIAATDTMKVMNFAANAYGNIDVLAYRQSGVLISSTTAPTIASAGCTSPAVTHNNGTASFLLTLGTSCTGVKTIVLTFTAAAHFWVVSCNNNTSDAQQAANYVVPRATSTTAVTITNYARVTGLQSDFTASDTLLCEAHGE